MAHSFRSNCERSYTPAKKMGDITHIYLIFTIIPLPSGKNQEICRASPVFSRLTLIFIAGIYRKFI
jgi:hypothetical protein